MRTWTLDLLILYWRGLYPFGHAGGIVKKMVKDFVFMNFFVKQSFTIPLPEGV